MFSENHPPKEWSNLSKIVYKRTYARKDNGVLENWDDTVERVIQGNVKGHNVPESEVQELLYFLRERKAGPGGRGLWYSGTEGHARLGGSGLNNCFAYETEILTENGIKKIGDLAGSKIKLLSENGLWVESEIKSFGEQKLLKLDITRKGEKRSIYTTANHRWFVKNHRDLKQEKLTSELLPGDNLCSNFGNGRNLTPSTFGIAHGLTFGDGTRYQNPGSGSKIRLCGVKNTNFQKYFNESDFSIISDSEDIEIRHLPRYFKDYPSLKESKSYLLGWLMGYFAADGSIKNTGKTASIYSTKKENLLFVRDVCSILNIGTFGIRQQTRISNLTKAESVIYNIRINLATIDETFFLDEEQKRRFNLVAERKNHKFVVVDISETDRYETVYCAVVPGTHSFTLEGNILTGNCWFLTSDDWNNFVLAQDLLMLGGGVGLSVEQRFTSKLPKIKKDVKIVHKLTKDADFIVPDSREGWCELTRRVLESYFVTGKSFSYSTICIRGQGEPIKGFGGSASGPIPLIKFVDKICTILSNRQGKHPRPIDCMDIICCTGEMVVAGNVRRSAIIILGDPFDKEYLKSKRWDLGNIPVHRAFANLSVVVDDIDDVHPSFWKTYESGEPFGIINRTNIQKYGRMGELKRDTAIGVNPCAEATLEDGEGCNLQEIALMNLSGPQEFIRAGELMHRYGKRVALERYHNPKIQSVISRNLRIGTGITGCLGSPLFTPDILDDVYQAIQIENVNYSKELNIPESIRTTVVKPSGCTGLNTEIKTSLGNKTMKDLFQLNGVYSIENIHPKTWIDPITNIQVFDENNNLQPITKLFVNGIEETFDIEFEDGKLYSFTGNHKLLTSLGWKRVDELTKDDEIVHFS